MLERQNLLLASHDGMVSVLDDEALAWAATLGSVAPVAVRTGTFGSAGHSRPPPPHPFPVWIDHTSK